MRRIEKVFLIREYWQGKMEIITFDTKGITKYMAKKVQKTPVSAAVDNLMAGAAPALKKSSITAGTAKRHAKATASAVIAAVETAVGTFVHKVAETAVSETGSVATQTVTHQAIAKLAYSYWLERGCQGGSPVSDWFRAEQALSATHS